MDRLERNLKIHSIFWPFGLYLRRNFYKNPQQGENPVARFVHYTSAEAALSIITSRRVWMRNAKCMADYSEVQHGFHLLRNFFDNPDRRSQFVENFNKFFSGASQEAFNIFDSWWNDINFNTFITSVSEHDDKEDTLGRLSMWRAFGGNTARVGIILKIPWLMESNSDLKAFFSPVAYLSKEEAIKEFSDIASNLRENEEFVRSLSRQEFISAIFDMLLSSALCLKHQGFREEREWRLIYSPNRTPSALIKPSTETIGGVPQIVHNLPLDEPSIPQLSLEKIFDRLIIGPSPYPWAMYQAFDSALRAAGISQPIIWTSEIPLRHSI